MRDQLVELAVHLQDLDDGHATPIALIVALVAADGPVQRRRTIGWRSYHAALAGARLVSLLAVLAQSANQALRDDAYDVAGEDVRDDADVEKPGNRAGGRIGVEGRIDLVSRHRRAERHGGRVLVANLADQDDIGVLSHERADAVAEIHLGGFVDRGLADQGHGIFDRILQGHDVEAVVVDVIEHRIERRRLATAGGARKKDDAFGPRDHFLEKLKLARFEPQAVERNDAFLPVEYTQHDVLAVRGRLRRDAEIDRAAREHQRDAPVLWGTCFGDVHLRHHLDAHRHGRPVRLVQGPYPAQHPIGALADALETRLRLDVNIGGG